MTVTLASMRAIWNEMLGGGEIAATDTFFALGGDSVLAMSVVLRIEESLGVSIEIYELFDYPDLQGFTARVAALATVTSEQTLQPASAP